jgi:hypothetical protein
MRSLCLGAIRGNVSSTQTKLRAALCWQLLLPLSERVHANKLTGSANEVHLMALEAAGLWPPPCARACGLPSLYLTWAANAAPISHDDSDPGWSLLQRVENDRHPALQWARFDDNAGPVSPWPPVAAMHVAQASSAERALAAALTALGSPTPDASTSAGGNAALASGKSQTYGLDSSLRPDECGAAAGASSKSQMDAAEAAVSGPRRESEACGKSQTDGFDGGAAAGKSPTDGLDWRVMPQCIPQETHLTGW